MFKLEQHIVIQENPKVVWAFLANLPLSQSCRRWRRSFRWQGSPTPTVGSRYLAEKRISGIGFRQEGKVTRWEPQRSITLVQWSHRFPRTGFTYQMCYTIERIQGQSQATTLYAKVVGNNALWPLEIIYKEVVRRSMIDHLVLLKRAIESTDKEDHHARQPAQPIVEASAVGG